MGDWVKGIHFELCCCATHMLNFQSDWLLAMGVSELGYVQHRWHIHHVFVDGVPHSGQ
jgi:hypothetical protein